MLSVYEAFKLVLGIVISLVILTVVIYFTTNYIGVQKDAKQAATLKAFLKSAGDVYTTGDAIGFAGLEGLISFDAHPPAGIVSSLGKAPVTFPLLLLPADDLFISANGLDLGWYDFRVVEATPRLRVLFNPVDTSDQTWDLVRGIVAAFPSTEFFDPKTTFGFCDGATVIENLCASTACEQDDFLFELINPSGVAFADCTATVPEGAVVIKVIPTCSLGSSDVFCLTPPNQVGLGNLYIGGEGPVIYKDPLDVVAAVIGGGKKDLYGNSGETLFEYKNRAMRTELLAATDVLKTRVLLLGPAYLQHATCQAAFNDILLALSNLSSLLETNEDYYADPSAAAAYVAALTDARQAHESLVEEGCDYA
ncbi:MAG: hypothetical protein HY369_02700 [Candidatus Aenigmarchaeota archaeon]|nr:hypothetical protein [Candidatus Aenigmarchaeota archaeon]